MLIFVYGTLKSGYINNSILSSSEFVKEALLPSHKLFYAGFPVMTPAYDEHQFVKGEIWDIKGSESVLRALDRLEGEGIMYDRAVTHTMDGTEVNTYIGVPRYWDFTKMRNCNIEHDGDNIIHSWDR